MPDRLPQSSPILFGDAMVRAILSGAKTQTRRLAGVPPWAERVEERRNNGFTWLEAHGTHPELGGCAQALFCKYGRPNDIIWVREAWATAADWGHHRPAEVPEGVPIFRRADRAIATPGRQSRWRPSIHMCRWMSRLDLEILSVDAERVQDISDADIEAEGVAEYGREAGFELFPPREIWAHLWDSTNPGGPDSWEGNPWCFKVAFRRVG